MKIIIVNNDCVTSATLEGSPIDRIVFCESLARCIPDKVTVVRMIRNITGDELTTVARLVDTAHKNILPDAEKIVASVYDAAEHNWAVAISLVKEVQLDAIRAFCDEVDRRASETIETHYKVITDLRRELDIHSL